jgi:hypothetical protein
MSTLWTRGDVQAAIDRQLAKVEIMRMGELPALLGQLRSLGETHGHPELVAQAIDRVRSMLPRDLVPPMVEAPAADLRRCSVCGFEWKQRDVEGQDACVLCQKLFVQNKLRALGVYGDSNQWMGQLTLALRDAQEGLGPLSLLGFEQQTDALWGTIDVVSRAQVPFEPLLLLVPPEVGEGVLVDIRIGTRSLLATSQSPISLSYYRPSSWGSMHAMKAAMFMSGGRAEVGQDVTLAIALHAKGLFRAALLGRNKEGSL